MSMRFRLGYAFRHAGKMKQLNKLDTVFKYYNITSDEKNDATVIKDFLLGQSEFTTRIERSDEIFLYLNNIEDFMKIIDDFRTITDIQIWKPDPAILETQDPSVLVSKLAKDYKFKVTVNIGWIRYQNKSTLKWIENNRDKLKISEYGLNNAYSLVNVYVRDEKVLMLLKMTGDKFITKIENLVLPK